MKNLFVVFILLILNFDCFSQSRYISQNTKKIVYNRDSGICQCCGSSRDLEYDHIVPYSCGGSSEVSNIQLLCFTCNRSKSNSCVCKVHNKRVGQQCCERGGTAKSPANNAEQCSGITKKGVRCKNKTTNSSGRCHLH